MLLGVLLDAFLPIGPVLLGLDDTLERPLPMVSWQTTMQRTAIISSTMRRLSGKRKYSHIACLITSAGKR